MFYTRVFWFCFLFVYFYCLFLPQTDLKSPLGSLEQTDPVREIRDLPEPK